MISKDNIQEITACAFIHKDNKLFVARRASTKKFLPDTYELPGGHVEFGETMEEALAREIKEEFNMNINIDEPFHAFTYTWKESTVHTIEVVYLAQLVDPNQEIKLNPTDHSKYTWITAADISQYFEPDDPEGQAARKGFELLIKPDPKQKIR